MLVRVGSLMSRLRNGLGNIRISPTLGSMTWTGYNPDIGGGTRLLYPAPAALSWTTYAPSIALMIAVGVGAATYTGNAPTVTGVSQPSDAETLAGSETDALAIVYTDDHFKATTGFNGSVFCVDSGTPANDYDSSPTTETASYFTYTSPSPKMLLHDDGVLKYAAHNLCLQSEDLTSTWVNINTTDTATTITDNSTSGSHAVYQNVTFVVGAEYVFTVRASADTLSYIGLYSSASSTGRWFNLSNGTAGSTLVGAPNASSITDVGGGVYECSIRFTVSTASAEVYLFVSEDGTQNYSGSGQTLNVFRSHLHRYPADTTYLKTTSASRFADCIEFNSSGTALGALVEPQRTNLLTYSSDLTNAAWTKSNMTTAKTATGPGSVANQATTCTATAGNATALQAITSSSAQRVTSVWLKRRTGTGNIDLTQDNGSTWTTVAVDSNWTSFAISAVTSANPTVGLRIVTSGDAVDVALFQHELGSSATSPIETYGSTVTRAAHAVSKAVTAYEHSATVNSGMVEYVPKGSASTATVALRWDDGTANEVVSIGHDASGNIGLTVTDGGAAQTSPLTSGTVTNDATETIGFSWKENDFLLSDNGATAVADTSGTLPTVTTLKIGSSGGPIYVKRILIVPVEKTAAEVEAYGAL